MRQGVMSFPDTQLGICAIAGFPGKLEYDYACHVGLPGENLKIDHQLRMIGILRRHAYGTIEIGQLRIGGCRFGLLDALLDLSNRIRDIRLPWSVGRTQFPLQTSDVELHQSRRLASLRISARRLGRGAPIRRSRSNTSAGCASDGSAAW
jgi:hypothetical protein